MLALQDLYDDATLRIADHAIARLQRVDLIDHLRLILRHVGRFILR